MDTTPSITFPRGFRKPRNWDGTLRFGVFWPYSRTQIPSGFVAAQNPDILDVMNHVRLVQVVERLGFDFVLVADGYASQSEDGSRIGFQDPSTHAVIWAVPLMMATQHLGIVSTMHTTYLHPIHLARFGGHLDCLSGGRWGWNIVTGFRENESALFGFTDLSTHDERYGKAEESVQIVKQLWTDPTLHHDGAHYRVNGRMRRPIPETMPLLVSAASSGRGRLLAGAQCDYLFAGPSTFDDVGEITRDLARISAEAGRAETPKTLVLADILIRDERARAEDDYEVLISSTDAGAQKVVEAQYVRVAHHGKRPGVIPALVGTADDVAEQILAVHRQGDVTGLLIRLLLWNVDEAARLEPMFARLREAGAWRPPETRGYSW